MLRIFLFILTNLAIIAVASIFLAIFHVEPYLKENGIDYYSLFIFSLVFGFTGSFISLFLSKWVAKLAFSIQIIAKPSNSEEALLIDVIRQLSKKLNIGMPEVGIYDSPDPNAFATGWSKNHSLVAVSSSLLAGMDQAELEGVLGHEMSHVANGDMVTMTLLQGVLNTFVIFFARVGAFIVSKLSRDHGGVFLYYLIVIVLQFVLGILATIIVMWFSRFREYRADAGSAKLLGKDKMIDALKQLEKLTTRAPEVKEATSFNAMKISSRDAFASIFASHPPIEKRIERLEKEKN